VLKAIENPKDNPVAWIAACVTNHRNREMQKRLCAKARNSGAYCSTAQSLTPCLSEASASFSPRGPTSPCSFNLGSQAANPQTIGSTFPASQRSDSQDPGVMAWAAETWSNCASNKSALIRAVQDTLTGDTLRMFRDLPPVMQACFATVWIFACPARGFQGQEMMLRWLGRYRSLTGLSGIADGPTAVAGMIPTTLTIQVIIVGCTAGYQYMMLEAAFKLATLRDALDYKLLPVLCCGADKHTETVTSTLTNQHPCIPWDRVLSESELAAKVSSQIKQWHKDSVRLLIVTTLPLCAMKYATDRDPEAVLHASATRHVWFSTDLSARVMSVLGQTAVVDVAIAPVNLAPEVKSLLETLVGPAVTQVGLQDATDTSQQVLFFYNMSLKGIGLASVRVADPRGPIDGWRLCGGQIAQDANAPLYIWRILPELLCIRMFNDRALTSLEEETLLTATIEHEPTKELPVHSWSVGRASKAHLTVLLFKQHVPVHH